MLGYSLSQLLVLGAAAGAGVTMIVLVRRFPQAGVRAWVLVIAFVPVWMGFTFVSYFPPASAIGIVVLLGIVHKFPRAFSLGDLLVLFFFACCLVPAMIGRSSVSNVFGVLALWLVAFMLGRIAPSVMSVPSLYSWIAGVFTVVAVAAILEFFLDWHPYEFLGPANGLHQAWGVIQERGGLARSEWAFGHSIALGASLAAVVPLTAASTFRPAIRVAVMSVMLAGVAVTLSRLALVCTVLGIVLVVLFGGRGVSRSVRGGMAAMLAAGSILLLPFILGVLNRAGSEAEGSSLYRGRLTSLIPLMDPLGRSSSTRQAPDGSFYFRGFESIDSQLVFTGLVYGSFAAIVGLLLLTLGVLAIVGGRSTPALIAVVAQIPALATVALITQYSMWFWFVAGLAIASLSRERLPSEAASPKVVLTHVQT